MDAPKQYGVFEFMKHGLFVSLIWLLFYELNPLHITFIYKYQGQGSVNKHGGDMPGPSQGLKIWGLARYTRWG